MVLEGQSLASRNRLTSQSAGPNHPKPVLGPLFSSLYLHDSVVSRVHYSWRDKLKWEKSSQ